MNFIFLPWFAVRAGRSSLLSSLAIYISVVRIVLFPLLVPGTIKITPIIVGTHDMARFHQVSVILHTLFTNKRYPVDSPFNKMKTHNNGFPVCEIFALTQGRQYPYHLLYNIEPVILTRFF
jgi:hypothetical protein